MTPTMPDAPDPAVEGYFAAVSDALRGVGAARRAEILGDLRGHLMARWVEAGRPRDVGALLRELGDPADIAAQAGLEAGAAPPAAPAGEAWPAAAIVLTALVWPVGLIVAAVSGRWRLGALAAAAAAPLLGWGMVLTMGLATSVRGAPSTSPAPPLWGLAGGVIALLLSFFGTPLAAAIHLGLALRRPRARPLVPVGTLAAVLLGLGLDALARLHGI